MSSYTLRVQKQRYVSLLSSVKTTLSYVSNAYNRVGDCGSIATSYSVNHSSSGYNLINSSKEELYNIMIGLRDTVIPWIENKIYYLNQEISNAEIEESAA